MDDVIDQLTNQFSGYRVEGGETTDGCWIRLEQGPWVWERRRLTSPAAALLFAAEAIRDHE